MSEQDPSRGRESGVPPRVSFDIQNLDEIRSLRTVAEPHHIALEENVPAPLEALHIELQGTEEPDGPYSLRAHLILRPNVNAPVQAADFTTNFMTAMGGSYAWDDGFYLASEQNYQYKLTVNEAGSVVVLETAGMLNRRNGEGGMQDQLFMHKDEFNPALYDFLGVSEKLLVNLFASSGREGVNLEVSVNAPATEFDEDADMKPLPPYMIKPKKQLDELAGMDDVKSRLMDIVDAMRHPELMADYLADRHHGIFLFGPSGTGKTSLAEAIATEINADMRVVRSSDIYGMYMGQSERNFQAIMDEARAATEPYVLLFDEIDTIIRLDGGSAYSAVAGLFKQEIGRIADENKNVVVIATSNKQPNEIDEALFRPGRFDAHIYIELPNDAARAAIFGSLVDHYALNAKKDIFAIESIDYKQLASATEGMNGAIITEIIRGAVVAMALHEVRTKTPPDRLDTNTILRAINASRQTRA